MNRLDKPMSTLHALRALGVRFSIDGFGTGYSSLAHLGSLPIDSVKIDSVNIDRSFMMGMNSGEQNVEIVRTVLQLGHTLGKTVVAEGVETPQQLQRMGVDRGPGLSAVAAAAGRADRRVAGDAGRGCGVRRLVHPVRRRRRPVSTR